MNKIYVSIPSGVDIKLKEVDKDGALVSGGKEVNGVQIDSTEIWSFEIIYSRYYTLYIDLSPVSTASTMFLSNGEMFFVNDYGNIESASDLDMGGFSIKNIGDGVNDTDAVAFGQVKNLISSSLFPSPLPSPSIDLSLASHVRLSIANPGTTPADTTYIFYIALSNIPDSINPSIDTNGIITSPSIDSELIIQIAVKTPYAILPKCTDKFIENNFVHFGYALMNSSGVSAVKEGTKVQIGAFVSIDSVFTDASAISLSAVSVPVLFDYGNAIHATIPSSETPEFSGIYEFLYGFLPTSGTEPTIVNNELVNMSIYSTMISYNRNIVIPKPLLPVGDYVIYLSYRLVTPFTKSNWWKDGSNEIGKLTMTKFPSSLSLNDLDNIASYIASQMQANTSTGEISRK